MIEIEIAEIDVSPLTVSALKVLKAAALHGFRNADTGKHWVTLHDFCRLAGLPPTSESDMAALLMNAQKALGIIHTVVLDAPESDDSPYGSWQILKEVYVEDSLVVFELYKYSFDARIQKQLHALAT
jgi:hypothetical protein